MSLTTSTNFKIQDLEGVAKQGVTRCRIPQRLINGSKPPSTSIAIPKGRSNYAEPAARPKSANRLKDEVYQNKSKYPSPRPTKPNDRASSATKQRQSVLPRKTPQRPVIMVPMTQMQVKVRSIKIPRSCRRKENVAKCANVKPNVKTVGRYSYDLPDQDTIKDLEQQISPSSAFSFDQKSDKESITSRSEKLVELKIMWQEKIVKFENMKGDLKDRQRDIISLYAKMRETHEKMTSLGGSASLPAAEELRIMNVANMSPEQLLQLCAGDDASRRGDGVQIPHIDINKLYELPSKLIVTCEETLKKRKEIIDWFETLKSEEKGISVHKLSKKINEFNVENDMLKGALEKSKSNFLKELEDIVAVMRKSLNETMALQLRIDELTLEMSELNIQNTDLRKQIHNTDHFRTQMSRGRVEELEKELKEEKCKRLFMRDRLSRSEGQVKINVERANQLEAALEQARNQIWTLERTVQQLHEQNQKLQSDFDKELCKLTESIKEHTVHLEEIAEAREKLQSEKEDLEKRLTELSTYYNESVQNMKQEIASNVAKLIEAESKCDEQIEEKKKVEVKLEVACSQLLEAELRYKSILEQLQEKEMLISKATEVNKEIESTKRRLEEANLIISDYKNRLTKQTEIQKNMERNVKEAENSAETIQNELCAKTEYINDLENKLTLHEQQLQENESKMEEYVDQLSSLKNHINQLQEDFGEFENLNELHEMLNKQRANLLEATRQNGELAEALLKKDKELEHYNETLSEHEQLLIKKEGVIKMLSDKEEEQSNIIKILRNNMELRARADNDLNQQVMEKNTEIDSLLVNLETRKQQISNMEKIILTLEEQTRKASLQRKKDQEYIITLQKNITDHEALHTETARNVDCPENLDSLIKILEDELGATIEQELGSEDQNNIPQKKCHGDRKLGKLDYHENYHYRFRYQPEPDTLPTRNGMGTYAKKFFTEATEEQYIGDNLDRKRAITNMDAKRWLPMAEGTFNLQTATKENVRRTIPNPLQNTFDRNLQFLNSDQQKGDRKYKMFKFASHRL